MLSSGISSERQDDGGCTPEGQVRSERACSQRRRDQRVTILEEEPEPLVHTIHVAVPALCEYLPLSDEPRLTPPYGGSADTLEVPWLPS